MASAAPKPTPFWLPASHFAAGLGFFAAATLCLPFIAPDLAAGRFLQPHVVATVHLITLGWLTLSIMGALCQLFPVVLGTPVRWPKLAASAAFIFVGGLVVFVAALATSHSGALVPGAAIFASGLLLFIVHAFATLLGAPRRELTWWTLALALFFLLATIAFGGSLAANYRWSHLADRRIAALVVHMHVAIGGWVLLVVMAVVRRLLPMFLLSAKSDELPLRVAVLCMMTGALLLTVMHGFMTRGIFVTAVLLMAVAVLALVIQIARYVRARKRPKLDAGLRLVVAGVALLVIGVVLGVVILFVRAPNHVLAAYGIATVGGIAMFVAGHYYKILPFLVWNHRYAPLVGKRPLPQIVELYNARLAGIAASCVMAGMYGLFVGALVQQAAVVVGAAGLLAAGSLIEAVQLLGLMRRKVV